MVKFGKVRHEVSTILKCLRLYLAMPLSYREVEQIMKDDGISVDHSTINLWVRKFTPKILKNFNLSKKKTGDSWRMDETYVKVAGEWFYLYRAVDTQGNNIDFHFSKRRNKTAAYKFLKKAIKNNGIPLIINIDRSGANEEAIRLYNDRHGTDIIIRKVKFLNNIIESDHRKIKRHTKSMGSFKEFVSAKITLAGIEMMNMLKKSQSYTGSLFDKTLAQKLEELIRFNAKKINF